MHGEILEPLAKEDEAKVLKDNLGIDVKKLDHYLDLFKQWITSQQHLVQDYNDDCLRKFLLWSKLDFDKAKKKFVMFCYNTLIHEELVSNRVITLERDLKCTEYAYLFPLSKLTPQGYRLTVHKIIDPDQLDLLELFRYVNLLLDYTIHKDGIRIGEILLYDMEHFKPQHYHKLFNIQLLKFLRCTERNFPFKIKSAYVINCHPLLEKGISLCKGVLNQKIAKRIILTTPQELPKHLALQYLPKDYGGDENSMDEFRDLWRKELQANEEFLIEISKRRPTGSVPEEFKAYETEFGIDGSFRKLNID
ncbi:hypothetical protein Trydic_g23262 [Trypoxylus dichotomus]